MLDGDIGECRTVEAVYLKQRGGNVLRQLFDLPNVTRVCVMYGTADLISSLPGGVEL
jgi:hypothetical protein